KWPAVAVAQAAAPAPGAPPANAAGVVQGDSPECAAKRGKPYTSEQDRTWFLQNCIRPDVPPSGAVTAQSQQRPAVTQPAPVTDANAAVCDTLRRSPNPTDEQRRWYFTY